MMEPEDGEGELPAGFQGMEVDGKRFILTPEFDVKGERVERLKVATATRLVMLHNKKTTRYATCWPRWRASRSAAASGTSLASSARRCRTPSWRLLPPIIAMTHFVQRTSSDEVNLFQQLVPAVLVKIEKIAVARPWSPSPRARYIARYRSWCPI